MNKKYIKRQITLSKLGIPMDSQLKEYYDYFHHLIDINNIEELTHEDYPDTIFWRKDGEVILEYNIKNEHFWVDYDVIWKKFGEKYLFNYIDISELLGGMLEEAFKLRVTTAYR